MLREKVEQDLQRKYSPEQISGRLLVEFPDDLKDAGVTGDHLPIALRAIPRRPASRACRVSAHRAGAAGSQPSRHPAQEPGPTRHGQHRPTARCGYRPRGARALGGRLDSSPKRNASAIGTLVERTTGYTMLVHLPAGYQPEQVAPALAAKIRTLPMALRGSLTWDQGVEMRDWKQVTVATDIAIFFCDPHSPWQRGTNENTNGLLRQYFPKGTDLSAHSAADLDWVANELNDRPRKRLGFKKPIELIGDLVLR